jgi:hypothetical protein
MDKGIIFSAPMVRALLDGRKTQTRRLAKVRKGLTLGELIEHGESRHKGPFVEHWATLEQLAPPRYAPGDRLYVRESAWIAPPMWTDSPVNPMGPHRQAVAYKADDRSGYTANAAADYKLRLRPSIHMPRWASRITLDVTEVRIQRLQEITEADAKAEGVLPSGWEGSDVPGHFRIAFRDLWNTLHTKPGERWEDNPWIVAVSFGVRLGNIDAEQSYGR